MSLADIRQRSAGLSDTYPITASSVSRQRLAGGTGPVPPRQRLAGGTGPVPLVINGNQTVSLREASSVKFVSV